MLGITRDALYLYEKKGLISPHYVNPNTKYRYYSINDLYKVSTILYLKNTGFTLSEVKNIVSNNCTMEEKYNILLVQQEKVNRMIRSFEFFQNNKECSCYYKCFPAHYCVRKRITVDDFSMVYDSFIYLLDKIKELDLSIKLPYFSYAVFEQDDNSKYKKDLDIFIEVEKANMHNVLYFSNQKYICTLHKGNYKDIHKAYEFLEDYTKQNDIIIVGNPLEHYINSFIDFDMDYNFITEVCFPIK
jgi:DNA-binding transcriptional MerR regulator/effector-binding domain-containing protein